MLLIKWFFFDSYRFSLFFKSIHPMNLRMAYIRLSIAIRIKWHYINVQFYRHFYKHYPLVLSFCAVFVPCLASIVLTLGLRKVDFVNKLVFDSDTSFWYVSYCALCFFVGFYGSKFVRRLIARFLVHSLNHSGKHVTKYHHYTFLQSCQSLEQKLCSQSVMQNKRSIVESALVLQVLPCKNVVDLVVRNYLYGRQ